MQQSGGRLLGQGVYGCTFDPAPRCPGGPVFKTIGGRPAVGKVTVEDIKDELAIGKAIMALPLAAQYFALPSAGCDTIERVDDPDVGSCKVITEAGEETKLSMLIMPAAGQQLMRWAASLPTLAKEYKRVFIHLLEGMVIYQKAGYVHNDIHMGNILIDEQAVARYIDFGLAFRLPDVKTWGDSNLGTTFKPKYVWQAPEVHAWRMMLSGVRLEDGVRQLHEINPEYAKLEGQFLVRKTAADALGDLMRRSRAVGSKDGGAFVRAYGYRFDSWRIGLCMWMLWDDLLHWSGFQQTEIWRERDRIRRVLGGLTDFHPRSRWSAATALAALDPSNRLATATLATAPAR
jgi:hypothetical protein